MSTGPSPCVTWATNRVDLRLVSDVGAERSSVTAREDDVLHDCLRLDLVVPVVDGDDKAFRRKAFGNRGTEPARGSGDECDATAGHPGPQPTTPLGSVG